MKTIDKLLFKIAERFALVEVLGTGATLIRISNLRILALTSFKGANSTLTIPAADRPSITVQAPALRTDANDRSTAMGILTVRPENGYVQRYYAGTYNASGSGVSNVAATDKISGIVAWIIGGGYGLTSILSRLSAIFRDWRWQHEQENHRPACSRNRMDIARERSEVQESSWHSLCRLLHLRTENNNHNVSDACNASGRIPTEGFNYIYHGRDKQRKCWGGVCCNGRHNRSKDILGINSIHVVPAFLPGIALERGCAA